MHLDRLDGQVIAISGSGRGIGKAIPLDLAVDRGMVSMDAEDCRIARGAKLARKAEIACSHLCRTSRLAE